MKKKDRQRLRRQKKHAQLKKREGGGAHSRIARGAEVAECWMNSDWQEQGGAFIYVLVRKPGGGLATASYVIDPWCAGLRRANGALEFSREAFHEMVHRIDVVADRVFVKTDPAMAKRLVAGGIRFARQNGFRLPRH